MTIEENNYNKLFDLYIQISITPYFNERQDKDQFANILLDYDDYARILIQKLSKTYNTFTVEQQNNINFKLQNSSITNLLRKFFFIQVYKYNFTPDQYDSLNNCDKLVLYQSVQYAFSSIEPQQFQELCRDWYLQYKEQDKIDDIIDQFQQLFGKQQCEVVKQLLQQI